MNPTPLTGNPAATAHHQHLLKPRQQLGIVDSGLIEAVEIAGALPDHRLNPALQLITRQHRDIDEDSRRLDVRQSPKRRRLTHTARGQQRERRITSRQVRHRPRRPQRPPPVRHRQQKAVTV
jgi:hypothetical protein